MPGTSKRSRQAGWRVANELDDLIRQLAKEEDRPVGRQFDFILRAGLRAQYPHLFNRLAKAQAKSEEVP